MSAHGCAAGYAKLNSVNMITNNAGSSWGTLLTYMCIIIESVDCISRDGPDMPLYTKIKLTWSRKNCKFNNFAFLIFGRIPFYRGQDRS